MFVGILYLNLKLVAAATTNLKVRNQYNITSMAFLNVLIFYILGQA